jgi:hypothetical protein
LASWAAHKLGKSTMELEAYRVELFKSDLLEVGEEDVIRKVARDLADTGIGEADVRSKMAELLLHAAYQIGAEG